MLTPEDSFPPEPKVTSWVPPKGHREREQGGISCVEFKSGLWCINNSILSTFSLTSIFPPENVKNNIQLAAWIELLNKQYVHMYKE